MSFGALAVVGPIWMLWGYSETFGTNIAGIIGDPFEYFALHNLTDDGSLMAATGVPATVAVGYQATFAIITVALISGAIADRAKFGTWLVFSGIWVTLVYSPIAHMVWGGGALSGGGFVADWLSTPIDFAGGTVVHISAGISGLIAVLYLGSRRGYPRTAMHPNNLVMVMIGVGLLWVGWFGFNAGSSLSSGVKTAQALTATQAAAAAGALAWIGIEAVQHHKATALGIASGVLAGLVVITPAAGVVTPAGAVALGFIASALCYGAILLKNRLGYDDTLDVFGVHGIAGITGAILLTFFIRAVDMPPGSDTLHQLGVQVLGVAVTLAYCSILTIVLVVAVQRVFGLRLGAKGEMAGLDHELHGEHGYGLLNLN
jgi:Amt family ammonium transporter